MLDKEEHIVATGYVSYEFKLKNSQVVNNSKVDVLPTGYFFINVHNFDIEYVKISGIWQKGINGEVENLLRDMPVSKETSMLFEPG